MTSDRQQIPWTAAYARRVASRMRRVHCSAGAARSPHHQPGYLESPSRPRGETTGERPQATGHRTKTKSIRTSRLEPRVSSLKFSHKKGQESELTIWHCPTRPTHPPRGLDPSSTLGAWETNSALAHRAREKRDRAIADARSEYEQTLTAIAALEHGLTGRRRAPRRISACIESVIPRTEPFTSTEILAALEALDSSRVWHKWTVDNHITKLRAKGIIRRISRHKGHQRALYVRADANVPAMPFENMTLPEVIRAILTEPMTQTELVVRMREAGFDSTMDNRVLRNVVGEELRTPGNWFQRVDGGKWVVAAPMS